MLEGEEGIISPKLLIERGKKGRLDCLLESRQLFWTGKEQLDKSAIREVSHRDRQSLGDEE